MDNSISINKGENNSMNFPNFIWTAKFSNCSDICQFDFITGIENIRDVIPFYRAAGSCDF